MMFVHTAFDNCLHVSSQTCIKLYQLYKSGNNEEAQALQKRLAVAEWGFGKSGINGTKWLVAKKLGYPENSSSCRRPYPKFEGEEEKKWVLRQVSGLDPIEQSL
jgi:4-hydroxy-2-oxoglutarate aldolase